MAEHIGSDIDQQSDIKYEEPEAPLDLSSKLTDITNMDMTTSTMSATSSDLEVDMPTSVIGSISMEISVDEKANYSQECERLEKELKEIENEIALTGPDGDKSEPLEKRARTGLMSDVMTDSMSTTSSKMGSNASSGKKSPKPDDKDAARKDKDKEREERIRHQRERLAEERQKKIEEMREQQRMAQEKRERQLELRRLKIEELRRRDDERRAAVEDRRRKQEENEKARKESIIQKSQERLTRYEQWKASGRKGGGTGYSYGFGSRTPREVCQPVDRRRSSSHSALMRRSPNGSDSDSYRPTRRAVSACSTVRRHCCIDINRLTGYPGSSPPSKILSMSTSVLYNKQKRDFASIGNLSGRDRPESLLAPSGPPPTRPKSTMNLSNREGVKVRDVTLRTTPKKPRPASIAGSMPSFVHVESPKGAARSKSTDRISRDRQKSSRATPKKDKDEQNQQQKAEKDDKKKFDIRKLTEKRKMELKKLEEKKKSDKKEEVQSDGEREKTPEKSAVKLSQKSIDRLSTPRIAKYKSETPVKSEVSKDMKEKTPPSGVKVVKKSVTIVTTPQPPPRKSKASKPKIKEALAKKKESVDGTKEETKELQKDGITSPILSIEIATEQPPEIAELVKEDEVQGSPRSASPASSKGDKSEEGEAAEVELAKIIKAEEKVVKILDPERGLSPIPKPSTPASASKSQKEIEMEEYKAKLAERRRQAREKAEREAELERQRQEEIRLAEEERIRKEEEEQKKMEEEAQRLAEEARQVEEERLRKAIEAEEQRKKEEAERLEQERKVKEEADRKAKEEAERLKKEQQERAKKEEEERLERKKRLESIMKRVKSDSPMSSSMSASMTGSLSGSLIGTLSESRSTEALNKILTSSPSKGSMQNLDAAGTSSEENGVTFTLEDKSDHLQTSETPKFKSPLLQKLVESKQSQNGSETPKFKSPLLQNLLGKKRLGLDKVDSEKSDGDSREPTEQRRGSNEVLSDSEGPLEGSGADVDSDKSESRDSKSEGSVDETVKDDASLSEPSVDSSSVIKTEVSSASVNGTSHNGEVEQYPQELVDSSISMKTVDSLGTSTASLLDSQTTSSSAEQVSVTTEPNNEFEELIDLSVTNKNFEVKSQQIYGQQSTEDLLNLNTNSIVDNSVDNITSESHPKPIIAFEDNAARRQQVPDILS